MAYFVEGGELDLQIIQGAGLVAADRHLTTADSSDPYCVVFVDGVEVGRTAAVTRAL